MTMLRRTACVLCALALVQMLAPAGPARADEQRFADPFAYCAAVGTIDAPDDRYTGSEVPDAIARGLKAALDMPPDAPMAPLLANSTWRCMDGDVYACTVGANLPCHEKADTSREPSGAVRGFCRQNPDADLVPMVVAGRATVFEWRCDGPTPAIVRQLAHPDARGYLADIWYQIRPDARSRNH